MMRCLVPKMDVMYKLVVLQILERRKLLACAHFGDSRARLYPASGPGKGRIYESNGMHHSCSRLRLLYIYIECLSNGIYSVPILRAMVCIIVVRDIY